MTPLPNTHQSSLKVFVCGAPVWIAVKDSGEASVSARECFDTCRNLFYTKTSTVVYKECVSNDHSEWIYPRFPYSTLL